MPFSGAIIASVPSRSSVRNGASSKNTRSVTELDTLNPPVSLQHHWPLISYKQDYSLRAKDHNEKKKRIKILREKAADRNPDEFAFGMMSSTSNNGIRVTQRAKDNGQSGALSMDVVKLLKTQDAGYLQTILQQTKREKEKVEKELVLITTGVDASAVAKKKAFDQDGNEIQDTMTMDMDMDMDTDFSDDDDFDLDFSDADNNDHQASASEDEQKKTLSKEQIQARRRKTRAREVLQGRLDALKDRETQLAKALNTLDAQRAKMNNTVGGVNKNGVKFKIRERKR